MAIGPPLTVDGRRGHGRFLEVYLTVRPDAARPGATGRLRELLAANASPATLALELDRIDRMIERIGALMRPEP